MDSDTKTNWIRTYRRRPRGSDPNPYVYAAARRATLIDLTQLAGPGPEVYYGVPSAIWNGETAKTNRLVWYLVPLVRSLGGHSRIIGGSLRRMAAY